MDITWKNELLTLALAEVIAETDHVHPAHAANRVRLALEIAERAIDAPDERTRMSVVKNGRRIDGSRASDATLDLVRRLVGLSENV